MRTIKFRGLMKNKNQWVYGDLINKCHDFNNHHSIFQFNGGCVKVKQATIGQYTGLKDKNGKEIYEGDVFHCGDTRILYIVVWDDTGFQGKQGKSSSYCGLEFWKDRIEVIGNVHENKEYDYLKEEYNESSNN